MFTKPRAPILRALLIGLLVLASSLLAQAARRIAAAQDDAPPRLLAMLDLVPASAATPDELFGVEISFADYAALDAAREGVPAITGWAQFHQLDEAGDESLALWFANRSRLASGDLNLADVRLLVFSGALMPQVVGFDYFDVAASLVFGLPPLRSVIYSGDLDPEAVIAAHTARDYTTHEVSGVTMLCGPLGGCDAPQTIDDSPREIDPNTFQATDENSLIHAANPFGGQQRQQYPLLALPGFALSSRRTELLESMAATAQGEAASLLDLPEYRAAAETITAGEGALIQVHFIHPAAMQYESAEAIADLVPENWPDLPAYTLAVMADRQEGDEQVALVALVYPSEAEAETGAAIISERLHTLTDPFGADTVLLDLPGIHAVMDEPAVYESETAGLWVAVAAARYPMPGNEAVDGQIPTSGRLFSLWYRAYLEETFNPLWIAAPVP